MSKEKYLNGLVSSLGVFYVKLHQWHWYVKGPAFYVLHEKFEEYYDEITEHFDEVAERMLMLGMKPASTLGEYVEHSFIKEAAYTTEMTATEMVEAALADYKLLVEKVQEGYDIVEGDEVTTDILVGLETAYGKHAWMLEFYLNQ